MSVARHSVRTCLLWRNIASRFDSQTGQELWKAFYETLDTLGTVDPSHSEPSSRIRSFLRRFVELASQSATGSSAQRFESYLEREDNIATVLDAWYSERAIYELFPRPIDRFAAAFYLGQMAYVLGRLHVARGYGLQAHGVLVSEVLTSGESVQSDVALRILRFLTVTLVVEVLFNLEGWNTFVEEGTSQPRLQFQPIFEALKSSSMQYVETFSEAADQDLLSQLARLRSEKRALRRSAEEVAPEALFQTFVQYYWSPVPQRSDLSHGTISEAHWRQLAREPLALAFELSSRNQAGVWLFRFRRWDEARKTFTKVLEILDAERGKHGTLHSSLISLRHEASLYLGRLDAQHCKFRTAEKRIIEALKTFERIKDVFAENKARKYLAELKYRQLDWETSEQLFLQVYETSKQHGFDHDAAVAAMFLGKILSRFGFQEEALGYLKVANGHFRHYDVFRETIECLFWQAAAYNRRRHWQEQSWRSHLNAEALVTLYKRFFAGIRRLADEKDRLKVDWKATLEQVDRSVRDERHPATLEVMFELRQGRLPESQLLGQLEELAEGSGSVWQHKAQAELCRQLLRLVQLQRGKVDEKRARGGASRSPQLKKFKVRSIFISAFEVMFQQQAWDPKPICLRLQETFEERSELQLRGGFVPSLVDLAQFFADREAFIALLLLLQRALDEGIEALAAGRAGYTNALDVGILKKIFRSITKYLVVERNLYLAPPRFTGDSKKPLWRRLERQRPAGCSWSVLYDQGVRGGHGLEYPAHVRALGWVDSLTDTTAAIRVIWLEDQKGLPLREESFETIEVPIRMVRAGHAESYLAPILLVGRHGELDTSAHRWVAHHLPDLDVDRLFKESDDLAGYAPKIRTWEKLYKTLIGQQGGRSTKPKEVSVEDLEKRVGVLAHQWFGGRLPEGMFQEIFGIPEKKRNTKAIRKAVEQGMRRETELASLHQPESSVVEVAAQLLKKRKVTVTTEDIEPFYYHEVLEELVAGG